MRIPSSFKLIACTWIAALLGALAGRTLAEVSGVHVRDASEPPPGAESAAEKVGER